MERVKLPRWYRAIPVLGLCMLATSCRSVAPTVKAHAPPATSVQLVSVANQLVDESEDFVATLESRKSVTLKPRVAGQVSRIFVRAGDRIASGQPILQIDAQEQLASMRSQFAGTSIAQAGVEGARADTARAEANLASAVAQLKTYQADLVAKQATLSLSEQQYKRYQSLRAEGAISQDALDQYVNTVKVSKANVETVKSNIEAQKAQIQAQKAQIQAQQSATTRAQQQVQQARANTQEQQAKLQYFAINAPFNGTVGDLLVKEGDSVDPSTNMMTLTQNDALEVNLSVPIEKAARLRMGSVVELINAQGQKVASSQIFFISPKASSETQSVLVKAKVNNAVGQLRADQFVRARLVWQQQLSVLVPTVAISRIAGQNFVFVAQQNEKGWVVKQQPIKLGVILGNNYQVLQGLNPGDQVVTSGILKLADGALITPASSKPAS